MVLDWQALAAKKAWKAFGTGRSAGTGGCAHETGDGTNALSSADAVRGRLRRIVRTKQKIHRVTPIDKFLLFMRVHQFSPFFQ